ncbi:MAG: hypothetical protein U1E67_12840 [Hyphomicrobiales bacterium]
MRNSPGLRGEVVHVEGRAIGGGEEGGVDGDGGDASAGDVEPREGIEIERVARAFRWKAF